jgi:MtN3 and saliva related transmembrane protein
MAPMIGFAAGLLTTLAFVPQVLKVWRSRSVADLSFTMLLSFAVGVALWIVYGVMMAAPPVVLSNTVTLIFALLLIAFKIAYR